MTRKDYERILGEYRNDLLTKTWFLEKQLESWSAIDKFLNHHFSKTLVFFLLFLSGASFYACVIDFARTDFWGNVLRCVGLLIVFFCFYLVGRFRRTLAAYFYMAYIQRRITSSAYLEKISRLEYELHQEFDALVRRIACDTKSLNECDINDTEKIKHIAEGLNYFSSELINIKQSLYDLNDIRKAYTDPENCFDLGVHNAVMEHHK